MISQIGGSQSGKNHSILNITGYGYVFHYKDMTIMEA